MMTQGPSAMKRWWLTLKVKWILFDPIHCHYLAETQTQTQTQTQVHPHTRAHTYKYDDIYSLFYHPKELNIFQVITFSKNILLGNIRLKDNLFLYLHIYIGDNIQWLLETSHHTHTHLALWVTAECRVVSCRGRPTVMPHNSGQRVLDTGQDKKGAGEKVKRI